MAPRRIDPRSQTPVGSFLHDGQRVAFRAGESLALALLAAGRGSLSRSPKYHRPRGPLCLRGACEGCLVRVGDLPGQLACRVPAAEGLEVRSQNAFPNASLDLFRVTDWFFPKHLDHHHLLVNAGATLNRAMQVFARRMAGLGTLPSEEHPFPTPSTLSVDALVVGAGTAGMAVANALAREGFQVACCEEEPRPGGEALDRRDAPTLTDLCDKVRFLGSTSAVATFDDGTLCVGPEGLGLVRARARVFATGCVDSVGLFPQNDLPGVFTARAAARMLRAGVVPGERVVVAGSGALASEVAAGCAEAGVRVTHAEGVVEAHGTSAVKAATVTAHGRAEKVKCDALVVALTATPAYELAGQAGALVRWDASARCFIPEALADGSTRAPGVYVTGSVRAPGAALQARREDGSRVALQIASDLRGGRL
ncbi:MAG: (2Fe-2S)-binding protein [Deltaproteobacteria bacterium]|nr:(2Fe-2S)-binding protein [Deltaproteobacteria bacterium]